MKRIAGLAYGFYTSLASILLTTIYTIQGSAQEEEKDTLENPLNVDSLGELLVNVLDGFVTLLIPVMVLAIVYTGFMMVIQSHNNPAEYGKLKNSLLWAFLGLFIVLGAKGILVVISNTVAGVLKLPTASVVQPDVFLATSTFLPYTLC